MNIENVKNILKDIPIFWINLERADKRREQMNKYFDKYALKAERIIAFDGNDINLEEYKKIYNINQKMNIYEIACTLSHLKAIQNCYDKNLDYALILEDDIIFDYFDYKTDTLLFLLDELKKNEGDCIQIGNTMTRKEFKAHDKKKLLVKCNKYGATSYLITKKGMEKVLNNFNNTKNIDLSEHIIFNFVNNYIVNPYFSYPFLKDKNGDNTNISYIRANDKSAHAVQTISKLLWDEYYLTCNN